ncbi:MAG: ABC transporter permease subunit [Okeania sp. SIO2C9]|uniref:ABC transporter permease n=1 Tax=Okeania sp. SIO2C9 TaxID=2607791 RepID=UPI0013BF7677|nr:ABC transporter permease subunit [Okeania sp. SIO2C9]NEQ75489.1 ABC transporter permease subunit [Okeania sp. SIO2C9]
MLVVISNILAIYRKELQGYFASPLAYAITGIFWLLAGYFLVAILLGPDGIIQQIATRDQLGITEPPVDAPYEFLKAYLGIMGSLSLFLLPMLSMSLYAEERKRGTLELLATSPITNWAVATGKLLAVLTFYTSMVLPLLGLEAIAISAAEPPVSPVLLLLGHGGLILLAGAVLSLGMFISSLTDSTILSAILTFALVLFLWVIDVVANNVSGPLAEALRHLSMLTHYTNIIQGLVDTSSIIMLLSYIVLGVFLTAQSIDALRFQRS